MWRAIRVWACIAAVFAVAPCSAEGGKARSVRLGAQYIEIPNALVTDILSTHRPGGPSIHAMVLEAVAAGKGRILESTMVVCRNGKAAQIQSGAEEIYPTEYPGKPLHLQDDSQAIHPAYRAITAFETRQTGLSFEAQPLIVDEKRVSLMLHLSMVSRLRLHTTMEYVDRLGDASIRMPVYESWNSRSSIVLRPGQPGLVSSITPKVIVPAPAIPMKILVFVRAEILD